MEAINFTAKLKKLELVKVPIPKVEEPDDILIEVAFSGICGTDLHIIQGEFPCTDKKPVTLGHEFSGVVVDVGSAVDIFKKGDRVSVDPNSGCGCCNFCHSGQPHYCAAGGINNTVGIYRNGGWANYAVVPVNQVHRIPDKITLQQAALTEPISCLAHGWDIISPIKVGSKILITGAGIIGNLWICALHHQGHRKVTVSEPNQARLDLLRKLDTGFDLITPDQLKENQSADPTYLFDVVIDCSGFPPAIEHAVSLLQKGGKLCCFGVAPPHGEIKGISMPPYFLGAFYRPPESSKRPQGDVIAHVDTYDVDGIKPFDIYVKELKIYGVLVNPFSFPNSIGLIEAMGDRYLTYELLGIKVFSLKQYKEALDELKEGTIAKAIFKLE